MTLPLPQPPAFFSELMIVSLVDAFAAVLTSRFQNIEVVKYGPGGLLTSSAMLDSSRSAPSSAAMQPVIRAIPMNKTWRIRARCPFRARAAIGDPRAALGGMAHVGDRPGAGHRRPPAGLSGRTTRSDVR